jgi:hypothetical protein
LENNGKRKYYKVAHALKYGVIQPEDIPKLIKSNKDKFMKMRDRRTHTIATKLGGNRIY